MRTHHIFWESRANGPGLRAVIFFQGCTLKCKNCINPETHDPRGGYEIAESEILAGLEKRKEIIEGITCSGGEPFQQSDSLLILVEGAKKLELSVIICTGYDFQELTQKIENFSQIQQYVDVIICGRFRDYERIYDGFRGSANKTYHFLSSAYSKVDLDRVHRMEIQVEGNKIISSGIDLNKLFPWSGFNYE